MKYRDNDTPVIQNTENACWQLRANTGMNAIWSATIESRTRGKGAGNRFPKILNAWRSITNVLMPTKRRERLKNHDFAYLTGCTSGLWGLKTGRTVCNGVPTSPSSTRRRNHTTVNIARPARVVPSCVSDKR